MDKGLMKTDFEGLKRSSTGKVRDIYELDRYLLIVATDRVSAFDVIMPDPIPGKGEILTRMSAFWFERTKDIIANHFVTMDPEAYPPECAPYRKQLRGRSMVVRKAEPLPVECVVRGYLSGSGWADYHRVGSVSGISLPEGLRESERLAEPLFTPTTKAPAGEHDLAITRKQMESIIGTDVTAKIIAASLKIYERASAIAEQAGIIIADTKMEFGVADGELTLIDELLTPDSSRFWPKADYRVGTTPRSYDKQFLRDYLTSIQWDKKPPAPPIPTEIIEKTREKYLEALRCLVR
ncbi:MAG: phosphoribosylaminoimidazolesuccinocarboxamide synthase [Deltaproteobacteria bacterium]|nr:phosphoribosylaminoimidazolesuccinocarboxamide synthase [Deltaproteobacteria bacterium]